MTAVATHDQPAAESARRPDPATRVRAGKIVANLSTAALYEAAVRDGEGMIAAEGPLVVGTGTHTGRSPKDKFIVREPSSEANDLVGRRQPPDHRGALRPAPRPPRWPTSPSGDCTARTVHRRAPEPPPLAARLHGDRLGEHLRAQPLPPADRPRTSRPSPRTSRSSTCRRSRRTRPPRAPGAATAILVHLQRMEIIIVGTEYAGEIKKSRVHGDELPACPTRACCRCTPRSTSARRGDSVVFFGLSGTGKTTLSADPLRSLIGDDEHGWGSDVRLQLRGRLLRQDDPPVADVRARHLRDDAALRDDPRERRHRSRRRASSTSTRSGSPRTRAAPTRSTSSATPTRPGIAGTPRNVVFLTADAFGVLPPISRLTREQAAYHFISGYTAKLAGTEVGVKEPTATFSAGFGAPFLPRHPGRVRARC